jgi:surface antigen
VGLDLAISGGWLAGQATFLSVCAILLSACSVFPFQGSSGAIFSTVDTSLKPSDKSMAQKNLQKALEKSLSGNSVRWQNPSSGARGSVTPLKTWKTSEGTYCRSFREKIELASGKTVSRNGVACRSAEAVWEAT